MIELGILILCEAIGGALLTFSLGYKEEKIDYDQAKVIPMWTIAMIVITLLGYGVMKLLSLP